MLQALIFILRQKTHLTYLATKRNRPVYLISERTTFFSWRSNDAKFRVYVFTSRYVREHLTHKPYLINSVTERPLFNFQSKIIKLNISVFDLCFGYWGVSVLCVSLWGLLQMGCLKPLFGQENSFCCSLTSCGFSIHIVWSMTQTDCAWNQNNINK